MWGGRSLLSSSGVASRDSLIGTYVTMAKREKSRKYRVAMKEMRWTKGTY